MVRLKDALNNVNCGDIKGVPFVVLGNGEAIYPEYSVSENADGKRYQLCAEHEYGFRDSLYFEYKDGSVTCRRCFENITENTIDIKELGFSISELDFGENTQDDYFYHIENPRVYMQMTFKVDHRPGVGDAKQSEFEEEAGNRWHDEGVIHGRIGASPYQPFPAILVSNYNTDLGVVHGSLSQKVFYHNYEVSHKGNTVELLVYSSFKAISKMCVASGKVLIDEWYFGTTQESGNIEKIFQEYSDALRKKLPLGYGRTDINRDNMIWGSWNDGVMRNFNEEILLREADYLKKNFPTVHWMQIDAGYAVGSAEPRFHGLGMPYEGDEGVDKEKFPDGLRSYTDKLRQIGMRPAIWVGGFCPNVTKIYEEHPDWFIDYGYRTKSTSPLDVSIKEVREYMEYAADTLCLKYGFDGVKHDFWSYAFEDSYPLLKNENNSGYEYREWWLKKFRSVLPSDGYFQSCCDIAMGNPFLSEYFTNYRYGIDISVGIWENVKTNYLWGMACFALHTGDLFVPNSDAVGMLPGLTDDEACFCINYCLVTHSMVEIAGLLSKAEHNERYRMLKKAVCNPNNGQDIYFVDYDYRKPEYNVPEIIYFKSAHFSKFEDCNTIPVRTVGIFNLEEEERIFSVIPEKVGLCSGEYIITDVWSGESYSLDTKFDVKIKPHASRLFAINKREDMQLLDANIRINSVKKETNKLMLEIDYALKEAELRFTHKVMNVMLNGKSIEFVQKDNVVKFDAEEKGMLSIEFDK